MKPGTLIALAVMTLVAVAAAALALSRAPADPRYEKVGEPVYPGLIDRVNEVSEIIVESDKGRLTVQRDGRVWGVRESDGHPASPTEVQKAILGVAELAYFEPKTAKPALYTKLDLDDPAAKGGKSKHLVLKVGQETVADLVVGRERLFLPGLTVGGVYFRLPGDPQSWLGRSNPEIGVEPKDWLRRQIADVKGKRVRRVVIRHPDGETVVVTKDDEKSETFTLHDIPPGMKLQYDTDANHIGQILDDLEMDDVRKADGMPLRWDGAVHVEVETYDGLHGRIEIVGWQGADWLRLSFVGDTEAARKEAAELTERTQPWVYRMPRYEVVPVLRKMADLVIPDRDR